MVTQNGIKLALHIIQSDFGDLVTKVCECLLRRGALSLNQIIGFTELKEAQVKNSLLVLIQHNCVQSFGLELEGTHGKETKVQIQYLALFDHIIHRMRFAKFYSIVSDELGKKCAHFLLRLLQHGRLSLSQISAYSHGKSSEKEGDPVAEDRETLVELLNAHYVERCPASEPFLALPTEEEASARKRRAKSAKLIDELETIEQRVLAAATPLEGLRFSLLVNTMSLDEEKRGESSPGISVGEKRKHETLELDKEPGAVLSERDILWRPNFEEFLRRLRHKACLANVKSRLDNKAEIILSAILKATARAEVKVKTEKTDPLSLNDIFEEVIKIETGRTMTLEHVRAYLVQLGCQPGGRGIDDLYSIDLKNIIHLAQINEVESGVLKKYGKDGYRIFRLLSKYSRPIENDKISETCILEKKDTTKILHKLWMDNYVLLERLALTGTKREIYLWKINKHTMRSHVLDDLYHAALNLRIRKAHELDCREEFLGLEKDKLNETSRQGYDEAQRVRMVLGSCLLNLDDAIMLFHDF